MPTKNESQPDASLVQTDQFLDDVIKGLKSTPKTLPCKYFYNKRGSELFDEICELEEYYPTRKEMGIMSQYSQYMADIIGPKCQLIELGSGSSIKTKLLLHSLKSPVSYVPVDISKKHLQEAALSIDEQFPHIPVQPVAADFTAEFQVPDAPQPAAKRVVFFPGSTIGNFKHDDAVQLLYQMSLIVGQGGGLLIGVDLKKDKDTLEAAYNDNLGVTAKFNKNILHRMKDELHAEFDPALFEHRSIYNEAEGRIEMHLVSRSRQTIRLNGQEFRFSEGETIHTENSHKYDLTEFKYIALLAGFHRFVTWTDDDDLFSVQYYEIK